MSWIYGLDLLGVFVFAISGVLTAIDNKFDVVGSAIIGMVTAIGGGTLRDILIGETPVGWMKDMNYLIVVFAALIVSYLFKNNIIQLKRSMFFFDTIGYSKNNGYRIKSICCATYGDSYRSFWWCFKGCFDQCCSFSFQKRNLCHCMFSRRDIIFGPVQLFKLFESEPRFCYASCSHYSLLVRKIQLDSSKVNS